jgi:hypothetical protein
VLTTARETVLKQTLNPTKPFWRFRANVLKRLTCIGFANDAPKLARMGAKQTKTGDDTCSTRSG